MEFMEVSLWLSVYLWGVKMIVNVFIDLFKDSVADKIKKTVKSSIDKKKLEIRFEEFCKDRNWNDLFENQGFRGGIDFYALTEDLKHHIVDDVYNYFHEIDVDGANENYKNILTKLYDTARAENSAQRNQVAAFLEASYKVIGNFLNKTWTSKAICL